MSIWIVKARHALVSEGVALLCVDGAREKDLGCSGRGQAIAALIRRRRNVEGLLTERDRSTTESDAPYFRKSG